MSIYWCGSTNEDVEPITVIRGDYLGSGHEFTAYKWSDQPPTQKGWYWVATNPNWKDAPEVVYVGCPEYDDRLHVYVTGITPHGIELIGTFHNRFPRLWLGPLPVPGLPAE